MKQALIAMVLVLLAGCGGGSGGTVAELPAEPPVVAPEPPPPPAPSAPRAVGACDPVHAEIARRAAAVLALPAAVAESWSYCDHYSPGYRAREWPVWGWLNLPDCDPAFWTWLIGCAGGWAFDGTGTGGGNVGALLIPPPAMDVLIAEAQAMGLAPGSRSWAEIRCLWTPERYAVLLIHEWHHAWFGLHHRTPAAAAAMAAADREARRRLMEEHGAWLLALPMPGCPERRALPVDLPVTERLSP